MDKHHTARDIPVQQTIVNIPQAAHQQAAGCCRVPGNASSAVKNTRRASIAILVIHIICMFSFYLQYIGNGIGIVMSIVVLTKFTKCSYTTAAVLYTLGFIFDVCSTAILIAIVQILNDSAEDDYGDVPLGWSVALTVPPALGAVSFLVGAVFAFKAVCNWEQSGAALDVLPA